MDHDGGVQPGDVISLVGRPAQGKAQPLSAKVLTNTGFTTMGELKIGDSLASVDGAPSMVSGVFPQGVKPVYRIEFTDGRSTEASDEHLWEVFYREWETPKVLTTLQLISKLKHTSYKKRLSVRYFSGVWGSEKQFTVSPYLMGFLLGDGCFRGNTLTFSSADEELVQRVKDEVSVLGCVITYRNGYDYAINCEVQTKNPITANLRDAGLWGKTSNEKYIPRDYLDTCEDQRWELLRGLMDTDGTAGKDGQATFCTTSMILAKQVQELVRGLGGRASIRIKTTTSLDAFIVGIVINDRARLFHLERKKNRVLAERSRHKQVRLVIDSIAYVGEKECQCISVSHPSHLYITDDYIVTHNTFQMLYIAIYNWLKGHNVLFVSMEMTLLPLAQRIVAMYAHTNITQLKKPGYSNLPKGNSIYDKFKTGLSLMGKEKAKFYVVDGNLAASAEDVYVLADQLKCKLIYVDGAYLMRHKNSKLDRFTRAAENVELMKRYCTDMGAATFSSWQFNRDAVKGKKKTDPQGGLEDIGYTDAIGQISSIVLGLFQDDGVETMKQRVIRVLKGRNGEVGQFNVNWLFNVMDFSQVQTASEESKKQLEYL
jgi:replicative DNA helicase